MIQSAGAAEYKNCISAEGEDPPSEGPVVQSAGAEK